jgi:hypothetical protein
MYFSKKIDGHGLYQCILIYRIKKKKEMGRQIKKEKK